MKMSLKQHAWLKSGFLNFMGVAILLFFAGCHKGNYVPTVKVTTVASGLSQPMGIEADAHGNMLVAEPGTANNDGKVVVVDRKGKMSDAIINLSSIKNALSGEPEGPANLLLYKGTLYILAGDYLYSVDVSKLKPSDLPLDGSKLSFEDIGSYVRGLGIVTPNDSHPYNLIAGPDGDIYIADAGANAIIHREGKGKYSVLAKLPDLKNTQPGPPTVQSVPTGIIFDGHDFLVSTLTGGPFPAGVAVIYRVSLAGNVSVYKDGFTMLTNIADGNAFGHAVLQFADGFNSGYNPKSGALILTNMKGSKVLADHLNMPVGLKQINNYTWLVTSMADGTVLKVQYD